MPKYDDYEYEQWKASPGRKSLSAIVNRYSGILNSELPKYKGNLPQGIIKSYGKKYMIDAIKTYNPKKGSLAAHISSNLRRLHRLNYDTSSVFRMSEELQRGVNLFKQTKEHLVDKYNREPTMEELSEALHWSPTKIARMEKQLVKESLTSQMEFSPSYIEMQDPTIDYLYHDLEPRDKVIFQYRTGYRGSPIFGVSDIAKKVKMSPATVSNRAMKIAKRLKDVAGER